MKIVLRKKNSVTSIVLFIYNIYGEIMKNHSIKLIDLIQMMSSFGKNETAIRMGLSRMVKSGILINKTIDNEVFYELTEEGLENINAWNNGITRFFERYSKREKKWNGKWNLISIFNFNKSDTENQFLVDKLKELGMAEVNNSLWISPYDISKEIESLFKNTHNNYLQIAGDINSNISIKKLIKDIYDLKNIKKKYLEFIKFAKEVKDNLEKSETEGFHYLKTLFELGWRFYDVVTLDPALPKSLIEDWEGDDAVTTMNAVRNSVIEKLNIPSLLS